MSDEEQSLCIDCEQPVEDCDCEWCNQCDYQIDSCVCDFEEVEHVDLIQIEKEEMETTNSPTVVNNYGVDRDTEMLLRTGQVLAKFASTLALQPVNSEIVTRRGYDLGAQAPAWSDASTIYLNRPHFSDLQSDENLIALRGLGVHEAAHLMLTPRKETKIIKDITRLNMYRAFNALEDQRIEMAMEAQFSNVTDWLTAAVARHALNLPPEMLQYQLPLVWGRKYLDADIRKFFYDVFPIVEIRDELCSLIDEYLTINLGNTRNYARATEIITRFHELIASGLQTLPDQSITLPDPTSPTGEREFTKPGSADGWSKVSDHEHSDTHQDYSGKESKTSAMDNKPQQKLVDKVKSKIDQANEQAQNAQSPNSGKPADGEGDGDGNGPVTGTVVDAERADSDGGGGKGTATNGGKLIKDWHSKVTERIVASQGKVLDTMRKQVLGEVELDGKTVKPPKRAEYYSRSASLPAVNAVKSFARELELLKAEYDPAWERKVDQGRLNVQRYVAGCDVDEAFDQWDVGREDAVDIECVIAVDNSGSMGWHMSPTYQYMWAIKRAMDKVGASTTVVTFSSRTELLYSADERATHEYRSSSMGNATEPLKAIEYAKSVLGNSKRAIKVFIPITDGMWDRSTECDQAIRIMRKGGVLTALALITDDTSNTVDSHGCEVAVSVTDCANLYVLARNMVRAGIQRNLR